MSFEWESDANDSALMRLCSNPYSFVDSRRWSAQSTFGDDADSLNGIDWGPATCPRAA
jgi:hypothetical protein